VGVKYSEDGSQLDKVRIDLAGVRQYDLVTLVHIWQDGSEISRSGIIIGRSGKFLGTHLFQYLASLFEDMDL
jgi:hypothetical protein